MIVLAYEDNSLHAHSKETRMNSRAYLLVYLTLG